MKKKKKSYYAFKLNKSRKKSKEVCETTVIEDQYPTNTSAIDWDSTVNCICEKPMSNKNSFS